MEKQPSTSTWVPPKANLETLHRQRFVSRSISDVVRGEDIETVKGEPLGSTDEYSEDSCDDIDDKEVNNKPKGELQCICPSKHLIHS